MQPFDLGLAELGELLEPGVPGRGECPERRLGKPGWKVACHSGSSSVVAFSFWYGAAHQNSSEPRKNFLRRELSRQAEQREQPCGVKERRHFDDPACGYAYDHERPRLVAAGRAGGQVLPVRWRTVRDGRHQTSTVTRPVGPE